ncbi:MAG: HD domain-containing protein [Acidimicrobiia bacterium]|nr:HD domain-containing protein [Acidimicrobiia bacterium]
MTNKWTDGERWRARRWFARITRAVVFLAPIVAAIAVAMTLASSLPEPTTALPTIGWWATVIGGSYLASLVVSRLAAKLLPLAALLNMSLIFPDQAPSRFRIALRSGSSGLLKREVERAIAAGADDDPTKSAEFALTLVASLGKHDRTTRGHAERTRAYADLIAEELDLTEADRDRLRWASLLHDIGKIEIDSDILQKNKPLDDEEWDIVREHPRIGYELTAPIRDFLGPWAQTILHHHERYDGLGYPTGVGGDDIALGARIVAVADAYDAMTAARSYQEPVSRRAALAELTRSAGTQFDPAIVRAFLSVAIGSMRRVASPWVVLAQLPFIGGLRRVADSGAVVAASVIGIVAPLVAGIVPGIDDTQPPAVVVAASTTTTAPSIGSPPAIQPSQQVDPTTTLSTSTSSTSTTAGPTTTSSTTIDPTTTSSTTTTTSTTSPTTTSTTSTTSTTTTTAPPTTTTTTTDPPTSTTTTNPPTTTTTTLVPPSAPDANPDISLTDEDTISTVDVLANDSDPDGDLDSASLQIVLQGSMGSASVTAAFGQADPVVTYVPADNEYGSDSFRYQVCDLASNCSTGSVFVTIRSVNDAPVAVADAASTSAGSPVDVAVLDNDYDVDDDVIFIASYDAVSDGGGIVNCTNTCVYTPRDGFSGTDMFSYTVVDGAGSKDATTVSVTVVSQDLIWYLRSSAAGDVASQPKLPLSASSGPTNGSLPNYDIDRDATVGLLLHRGPAGMGSQLAETDSTKFQLWSATLPSETQLAGSARVTLHAAMKDMNSGRDARVRVFLLDCASSTEAGADCSTIAVGTVTRRPWAATPDTWIGFTAYLGDIDYPIVAGRAVVVKVVVGGAE